MHFIRLGPISRRSLKLFYHPFVTIGSIVLCWSDSAFCGGESRSQRGHRLATEGRGSERRSWTNGRSERRVDPILIVLKRGSCAKFPHAVGLLLKYNSRKGNLKMSKRWEAGEGKAEVRCRY